MATCIIMRSSSMHQTMIAVSITLGLIHLVHCQSLSDSLTDRLWLHFSMEDDQPHSDSYSLAVNDSGPVVIDSFITFYATLYKENKTSTISTDNQLNTENITYVFKWETNACNIPLLPTPCLNKMVTSDITKSVSLTRVYSKYDVLQHRTLYDMKVEVHEKTKDGGSVLIVEKLIHFVLTETLNGELHIHQDAASNLSLSAGKYSTATDIMLNTTFTDHFHNPTYTTVWRIDGPHDNVTYHSHNTSLSVLLSARGHYVLYVAVIVHVTVQDRLGVSHITERNTSFTQDLLLIDPVTALVFSGDKDYNLGRNLSIEFTCLGSDYSPFGFSPPFQMMLAMIDPDGIVIQKVWEKSNKCRLHIVQQHLDKLGRYRMNLSVDNDVSSADDSIDINVENTVPPGVKAVVPIFAVIIMFLTPTIIIYSYMMDRRRQINVESANFSFRDEDNRKKRNRITGKMAAIVKSIRNVSVGSGRRTQDPHCDNNNYHYVKMKTLSRSYGATA